MKYKNNDCFCGRKHRTSSDFEKCEQMRKDQQLINLHTFPSEALEIERHGKFVWGWPTTTKTEAGQ